VVSRSSLEARKKKIDPRYFLFFWYPLALILNQTGGSVSGSAKKVPNRTKPNFSNTNSTAMVGSKQKINDESVESINPVVVI
jgi:hypothetical protein